MIIKTAMEKMASHKLPDDIRKWNQEILRYLFETYEWLDVDSYHVQWTSNFDSDKGYGTGVIVLHKDQKSVSIPFVVKEFELSPIEVFYYDDRLRPITEKAIGDAFYNTNVVDKIVDSKGKESLDMLKNVFPPRWGKYVYASEKSAVRSAIVDRDKTAGYRLSFLRDGALEKQAASYIDVFNFAKEHFGMEKEAVDQALAKVDGGQPVLLAHGEFEKSAAISSKGLEDMKVEEIRDDSHVVAQTKTGELIEGHVIPMTLSLDTRRFIPYKMMIDNERNIIATGDRIVGHKKGRMPFQKVLANTRVMIPRQGSIISFAWRNEQSLGGGSMMMATQPGKLLSVETLKDVGPMYTIMTPFGNRARVILLKDNRRVTPNVKNEWDALYLPERSVILMAHGTPKSLVESVEDFKRGIIKKATAVNVEYMRGTSEFLVKIGSDTLSGTTDEVRVELVDRGVELNLVDGVLGEAIRTGHATIYMDDPERSGVLGDPTELWFETLTEIETARTEAHDKLIKVASQLDDKDTIDEALSLNFSNPRNLAVFFKMLPRFKEAVYNLAHLLLASRIGKIGVSDNLVSEAMFALQNLVERMEGFETSSS